MNDSQIALDAFESTENAAMMGRALLEWSGIDPSDADRVTAFREAIGWSSIPEACAVVAENL